MNLHRHDLTPADAAGRMCPFDYRYPPQVLHRAPDIEASILYVAGGLYGNLASLDEIERMAAAENAPVTIVFNGDFHWFDTEPAWFSEIERRIARYRALRGNVETEIARDGDIGAGCGCAYPESVDHGVVSRSNEILAMLRAVSLELGGTRKRLSALPMHLVAQVGSVRVGIVHGDAWSLAGWRFAADALDAARPGELETLAVDTGIDVFASTHTCLAALRRFGPISIINNGAAGMPNFAGTKFGLISRIGTSPSPHPPLYGHVRGAVHIDALPVRYDNNVFAAHFARTWAQGSAAHLSYFDRIVNGPAYAIGQAAGPDAGVA